MKTIKLLLGACFFLALATFGYSSDKSLEGNYPSIKEITNQGQRIKVPFDIGRYKIYAYYSGNVLPPEADSVAYAISNNKIIKIKDTEDLSSIINKINTPAEALEFARLFTNAETEFLFKDPNVNGIELLEEEKYITKIPNGLWFKLKDLQASVIKSKEGFRISRILLMRDRNEPEKNNMPILVKTNEIISKSGKYEFSVGEIIPGGEQLDDLTRVYR